MMKSMIMRMVTIREGGGVIFFYTRVRERENLINARALLSLSVDLLAPADPPAAEPAQHRCKTAESQGVCTLAQSSKFTS
jgi:hypothetical protein